MKSVKSRTRVILLAVVVALAALLTLSACGSKDDDSAAASGGSAAGWPRTVATDKGDVTIKAQPERIVSTSTTLTGALLAMDAPVIATAVTKPGADGADDKGFFSQWADVAKKRDVDVLWENAAPDPEKVVPFKPDLIVVAATGGDSAIDLLDKLKSIAPTVVVDWGNKSWQDGGSMLAKITGHEADWDKAVDEFNGKVEAAKAEMDIPTKPVSALINFDDGSGAAALTSESAQSKLLTQLGFTLTEIPESVRGNVTMGSRSDIVELSKENLVAGLPGETWIVVAPGSKTRGIIESDPAYQYVPAVKNKRVYYMPADSFRLDPYSASNMVDSLKSAFPKK